MPNEDTIDVQTKNECPSKEDICRICLDSEQNDDNPLIAICNCTGGTKFVHFLCLKTWLHSMMEEKVNSQLISYFWKSFHCEICTACYPCNFLLFLVSIICNKKRYELVDIPRPINGDFLLIESISKDKACSRAIHILVPSKIGQIYKVGRGHDADIKMSDISVSRVHSIITSTKNGFTIKDNNAKFGTLTYIKRKNIFLTDKASVLQIGRTKIIVSLKDIDIS